MYVWVYNSNNIKIIYFCDVYSDSQCKECPLRQVNGKYPVGENYYIFN